MNKELDITNYNNLPVKTTVKLMHTLPLLLVLSAASSFPVHSFIHGLPNYATNSSKSNLVDHTNINNSMNTKLILSVKRSYNTFGISRPKSEYETTILQDFDTI